MMTEDAGAPIVIAGLPNLRDIGGWATSDGGRVRRGMAYRSVELGRLGPDGVRSLAALGIRTVYDLRTAAERSAEPDRTPDGVTDVPLDVLADMADASAAASLFALLADPAEAEKILGGGRAEALFVKSYRDIVSLPSALSAYRRFFLGLTDPATRPALFHCTTGKDRTGWGAAALLMLLGVSDEDVQRDYLLTNDELLPALQPIFDRFGAAGGDPELLRPVLGVREEYLATALDEVHSRWGDIDRYYDEGLGLDATVRRQLRDAFVEPAAG
ncbi:MAG TPA: tyrosine-protein phosphatase [Nakamurella sp.]